MRSQLSFAFYIEISFLVDHKQVIAIDKIINV